jgi:hypothetical protein
VPDRDADFSTDVYATAGCNASGPYFASPVAGRTGHRQLRRPSGYNRRVSLGRLVCRWGVLPRRLPCSSGPGAGKSPIIPYASGGRSCGVSPVADAGLLGQAAPVRSQKTPHAAGQSAGLPECP